VPPPTAHCHADNHQGVPHWLKHWPVSEGVGRGTLLNTSAPKMPIAKRCFPGAGLTGTPALLVGHSTVVCDSLQTNICNEILPSSERVEHQQCLPTHKASADHLLWSSKNGHFDKATLVFCLELHRTEVPEGKMTTPAIVEHHDIAAHCRPGLLTRSILFQIGISLIETVKRILRV
jgi:hypothetical protein